MVTKMQAVASLTTLIVEVLKDYGLLINIDLIDHQFEIFYFKRMLRFLKDVTAGVQYHDKFKEWRVCPHRTVPPVCDK